MSIVLYCIVKVHQKNLLQEMILKKCNSSTKYVQLKKLQRVRPSTRNSLPLSVRDPSLTLTQFCARLKTVLFCRAYETLA